VGFRDVAGGSGRNTGFCDRCADWKFVGKISK
jgi:hypothetical protein